MREKNDNHKEKVDLYSIYITHWIIKKDYTIFEKEYSIVSFLI